MIKRKRTKNTGNAAMLWLALVSVLAFACSEPKGGEDGENSTFSITIGDGESRAALSWDPSTDTADLAHTITLTGLGNVIKKEGVKYGQTEYFTVIPGSWNIEVRGYLGSVLKSEGFATVNLKTGSNGTVKITMQKPGGAIENGDTPITNAEVVITAPVGTETPATTATVESGNFTAGTVTWLPADNPFQDGTVYTATVTLTANSGYTFTGLVAANAKINGQTATVTNNTGSAVTLSYTFPPARKPAKNLVVKNQPSNLSYTHGDVLNLTGLVVTLTYNNDTIEDVAAADFTDKDITAIPSHGDHLAHTAHNGLPVTITYGHLTATTDNLTVNKATITKTAIEGVIAPIYGNTPVSTITASDQYTGTVVWKDAEGNAPYNNTFDPGTVYTATITLSPTENYTLTGVAANFFTVTGTTSVSNAANSGVINAVFPKTTHSGSGIELDPFLVFNVATLSRVGKPTTGGDYDNWTLNKHYKQIRNITLPNPVSPETSNWTPIGTYTSAKAFTGVYDGGNFTISNLKIDTTDNFQGLFGNISAVVKNVGIVDCDIKGGGAVGGIVGYNTGTVQNCYTTGNVSGTSEVVGGVVGGNYNEFPASTTTSTVQNCYSTGKVTATGNLVGGVLGFGTYTVVKNCVALNPNVSGSGSYVNPVAGANSNSGGAGTGMSNNYRRRDMKINGADKSLVEGPSNSTYGKSITSADWGNESFWTSTGHLVEGDSEYTPADWVNGAAFDQSIWDFSGIDGTKLPKLKNMPGGLNAQNPVIKPIE